MHSHLPGSIRLLALLLALDILLDSGLPLVFVALVQGVDLSPGGDLHVGVCEDELPDGGVEHESVDLLVDGDDHHGGAAVEGVPRGHHLAPRLEGGGGRRLLALLQLVDAEDGADGDEAVDVGAAVEGVEGDDVPVESKLESLEY